MTRSKATLAIVTLLAASCRNREVPVDATVDAPDDTREEVLSDVASDRGLVDVAMDPLRDRPTLTHPAIPGCNLDFGIECDGDWRGINPRTGAEFCSPGCAASQCCVPQDGQFVCVEPSSEGFCPVSDIFIDATKITDDYSIETASFGENSCEIAEQCVSMSGQRRLLRFDTWTPNIGMSDMFLGQTPSEGTSTDYFDWSPCHGHHHFNSYADYQLLRSDGTVVATGHKQAFCLLDFYQYPQQVSSPFPFPVPGGGTYTCDYQGIRRNWQDVYESGLPCQWVDITDVPAGAYQLRIRVNYDQILAESDYSNNEILVPVVIPAEPTPPDVTLPCSVSTSGAARDCGWIRDLTPTRLCTPGSSVTVGCSSVCGLGSCAGNTVVRVCDQTVGNQCTFTRALVMNDDSSCGVGDCFGSDCCSQASFTCPASGIYSVFWGSYTPGQSASCTIDARVAP